MTAKIILAATLSAALSGCIIHVGGDKPRTPDTELSTVFGSIDLSDGEQAGNISTVNGGIELADNTTAKSLDSVNGGIELGQNVVITKAAVVNGDIEAGDNLVAKGDLEAVNGDITISNNSKVGGTVSNVNGDIRITDSTIKRNILTVTGDIHVLGSSRVQGDVIFEQRNNNKWNFGSSRKPELWIDKEATIEGEIILKQPVTLHLSNPDHEAKVRRQYRQQ